jgi:polyhydroxybutyrate depolymerase
VRVGRTLVAAAGLACTWLVSPLPGPAVAARPASCTVDPAVQSVRVASQGWSYDVLVHVPPDARPGMPLVFNLHGSTQSGSAHRAEGAFDAAADTYGYIVAYPDGGVPGGPHPPAPVALPAGYYWNIPGVPLVGDVPVPPGSRDDVKFISDAIDASADALCVDLHRVYVTGASGGGRMASHLGCVLSTKVAAIAPVIGVRAGNPDPADDTQPDATTCQPDRPMPVAALHGERDTTNPYEGGGSKYWRYSVPVAMERWAELNHCQRKTADEAITTTVTLERWTSCREGADLLLYRSSVMGHTWPGDTSTMGTVLAPAIGATDPTFAGNDLILRFFDQHRLEH